MRSKAWRFLLGSGCGGGNASCTDDDRRPLSMLNQSAESIVGEDNPISTALLLAAELELESELAPQQQQHHHHQQQHHEKPPQLQKSALKQANDLLSRPEQQTTTTAQQPARESVLSAAEQLSVGQCQSGHSGLGRWHRRRTHRHRACGVPTAASVAAPASDAATGTAEWSVTLYDFDGRGCITKQDLAALTRSLSEVLQRGICGASGDSVETGCGSGGGRVPASLSLRLTFVPAPDAAVQQENQRQRPKQRVISVPLSASAGPLPKRRRHRSHSRRRQQPQHPQQKTRHRTQRATSASFVETSAAADARDDRQRRRQQRRRRRVRDGDADNKDAVDLASTIAEPPARHSPTDRAGSDGGGRGARRQQRRLRRRQLRHWPASADPSATASELVDAPTSLMLPASAPLRHLPSASAAAAADAGYHCVALDDATAAVTSAAEHAGRRGHQQQPHHHRVVERHRWRRLDAMQLVAEWLQREPLMQLQPLPSLVLHEHRHHHHYHYHFYD
ncbi:hypothetical protein BOX15_Mlig034416g1 [Macrostomum lignano]|uniref:Uncharacterized protein n=1 Tax=Macrostomum lignano TaxID=282301 RepID=A0A267E025_9PLAT|nr:hypothetical protein BOX15_Mlig034416g1 [Macrostomum lignano]